MSRSYKHIPIIKYREKNGKQRSNKALRAYQRQQRQEKFDEVSDIVDGKMYRHCLPRHRVDFGHTHYPERTWLKHGLSSLKDLAKRGITKGVEELKAYYANRSNWAKVFLRK